jgi:hypothetical protein
VVRGVSLRDTFAVANTHDSNAQRTNGSRKIYLARLNIPVTMLSS